MLSRRIIRLIPILLFTSIILVTLINVFISHSSEELSEEMESPSFPQLAFEQEFDKIKNPITGEVPGDAIYKAYQSLNYQGKISKSYIQAKNLYVKGWKPFNDYLSNLCITKMTYDPRNTKVFYFCTGEGWFNADAGRGAGVWKSTDGGDSWIQLPSTTTNAFHYCQDI
ncbi:MAG: hypothetical protein HOF35_00660, partial [Bacteroidetes bacterium]|nr:hypothetical protein [Bacteroidota bacterium]